MSGYSVPRVNRAGSVLIGLGGLALAIAPFLTWIKISLLGLTLKHLSLFDLLAIDAKPKLYGDIIVAVGLGVTVIALVLGGSRWIRLFGLIVAVAAGAVLGPSIYRLVQIVSETHHILGEGAGVYLMAGAEGAFVLGTLVG
jgi:hypothetical protein